MRKLYSRPVLSRGDIDQDKEEEEGEEKGKPPHAEIVAPASLCRVSDAAFLGC
jgi:hypothetical protein